MTREEAIEVLDDMKVKIDIPKSAVTQHKRNEALDMAISALSENKGENKHGHWKVGFGNTWCSCSECSGNGSTNWSYCPWCGADMRGEFKEMRELKDE